MEVINIESNITLKKSNYIKKKPVLTPEEKILKKKEQLARYALNYYRKRVEKDPEYLKRLSERAKRNSNIRKGNNPDEPPSVGRPRTTKYDIKN